MPAAWTAKDERQYGHIVKSCLKGGRPRKRCKSMAAATVNKGRRREGRTLSGLEGRRRALCLMYGKKKRPGGSFPCIVVKHSDGTVRDRRSGTTYKNVDRWRNAMGFEGLDGIGHSVPLAFAAMAGVLLIGVAQKAAALQR
jgi:hypothetical protein